jgi:hypothetical protein
MSILRFVHNLISGIFEGNPRDFYHHWDTCSSLENDNEFYKLNMYSAVPSFFRCHAYSLSAFLVALESISMRGDVGYGNPMEEQDDGCWFPENDDYNEIPLSQIMFKIGDDSDHVSDGELKTIILIVANTCLSVFNKYSYPMDMPERSRLAEIIMRAQKL